MINRYPSGIHCVYSISVMKGIIIARLKRELIRILMEAHRGR